MPSSVEDYEILEPIGSGTFGTCKKIRRKRDGKILVWKEIDYSKMSEDAKQMLVVEVNLLRQLRHENIVRYYDRVIDKTKAMLYIVMEYCEGGDLASYIKTHGHASEDFVWQICQQAASALKECHSRAKNGSLILHRDLKPANIFLDSRNCAKLGDFGLARILQPNISYTKTCVGTPYYMSPEQLLGNEYNEKSDVWSLGCILYELCALHVPFVADSQFELIKKVTSGRLVRIPSNYSDGLFSIISSLLEVNPSKRFSVELLLQHPLVVSRSIRPEIFKSPATDAYCKQFESLRLYEIKLNARETAVSKQEALLEKSAIEIGKRLAALEEKEKTLKLKEKLAEERMSKAEKLMEEYAELKLQLTKPSSSSSSSETDSGIKCDKRPTARSSLRVSTNDRGLTANVALQAACTVLSNPSVQDCNVNAKGQENLNLTKRHRRVLSAGKLVRNLYSENTAKAVEPRCPSSCTDQLAFRNLAVCGQGLVLPKRPII